MGGSVTPSFIVPLDPDEAPSSISPYTMMAMLSQAAHPDITAIFTVEDANALALVEAGLVDQAPDGELTATTIGAQVAKTGAPPTNSAPPVTTDEPEESQDD